MDRQPWSWHGFQQCEISRWLISDYQRVGAGFLPSVGPWFVLQTDCAEIQELIWHLVRNWCQAFFGEHSNQLHLMLTAHCFTQKFWSFYQQLGYSTIVSCNIGRYLSCSGTYTDCLVREQDPGQWVRYVFCILWWANFLPLFFSSPNLFPLLQPTSVLSYHVLPRLSPRVGSWYNITRDSSSWGLRWTVRWTLLG